MNLWQQIANQISRHTGQAFAPAPPKPLSGGCISQAQKLSDGHQHWFVKTNGASKLPIFEAEAEGLSALRATQTIGVPAPLCWGEAAGTAYLVLEFIESGPGGQVGQIQAGQQLAALHQHTAQRFGWQRNNSIGATFQSNDWQNNWIDFWREQRLGFQLNLAARNGYSGKLQDKGEQLLGKLDALIDHAPQASLLHGDLWGGNITFDEQGQPVIFDPAVYYGDRETDLAMTELFGGFSPDFYAAYKEAWPLPPGYMVRKHLYNLYHILNHLNLFGGGYASQAEQTIDRLLAAC